MDREIWNAPLHLRSYTFYDRTHKFVRNESAFYSWVMIGVESGAFDYEVSGERGHAVPGELVFANPHESFWRNVTEAPITYHVLQWSFGGEGNQDEMWRPGKWPVHDVARLWSSYAMMRPFYGQRELFSQRRVENLLQDILMLAWETRFAPPEVSDPTMREAAIMLRERVGETFSMEEVSGAVGLRPVQFTRRFRAAHGITPIEYLTRLRLENARKLLIETDVTLDEIAERCGWSSGYYLSSVFKNAFGMAPGKFRRTHRV